MRKPYFQFDFIHYWNRGEWSNFTIINITSLTFMEDGRQVHKFLFAFLNMGIQITAWLEKKQ